ncbi:MAG: putative transporter [Devosia sp.]|uniref:putative transporter n=1 Tax=Devosia sp. TaxID=1871048 RepID=UPI001ACCF91A|nr:putative transporter [Devosia sp.]MBN9310762.1 putative transporter [Devosia sp.]MBN9316088.1 putative transporter [Devosia sp.]
MFRSFFPEPKLFFPSAVVLLLIAIVLFFGGGAPLRSAISIDRFLAPAICAPDQVPAGATDAGAPPATDQANPNAPASTASPAPAQTAAPANCVVEDRNFLNGGKIWEYQFILMFAVIFCVFWYFYRRNEWYWWSVVGTTALMLSVYGQVQIDAWVNDWQGGFFNVVQQALSQPRSVPPEQYWPYVINIMAVLLPNIIFLVLLAFFTSHYVFRWRKAMTSYYMAYWPSLRTVEGSAQRVQEDTMRFASIVEDLGTSFVSSLITLVVFLPILWELSKHVSELPLIGAVPGSLVWVSLVVAAFGTVLLWVVGIKLPGLNFENQKVEAALRKELVYGEDDPTRADPPTFRQLFANVQRNYFRLYFHYTYFNLARYAYLQVAAYVPLLTLSPSILAGTLTLGIYQQVQNAFGQVASSFQFFARAWTTIVELMSIYQRLQRFESFIPADQAPIKESVSQAATS